MQGNSIPVTPEVRRRAHVLHAHGGTPLGNSRVKLTNVADCVKRGLVKEGEEPLKVAANAAGEGRHHHPPHHRRRRHQHHRRRPRGLSRRPTATSSPWSACPRPSTMTWCRSARRWAPGPPPNRARCFFENVVNEQSTSSRQLVIHEVMGRHCGWLTAATARAWRERLDAHGVPARVQPRRAATRTSTPSTCPRCPSTSRRRPKRLKQVMDEKDSVIDLRQRRRLRQRDRGRAGSARARRWIATPSATSSSTRSRWATGSASSSPRRSAPTRRWCRSPAISRRSAAANKADLELIRAMVACRGGLGPRRRFGRHRP